MLHSGANMPIHPDSQTCANRFRTKIATNFYWQKGNKSNIRYVLSDCQTVTKNMTQPADRQSEQIDNRNRAVCSDLTADWRQKPCRFCCVDRIYAVFAANLLALLVSSRQNLCRQNISLMKTQKAMVLIQHSQQRVTANLAHFVAHKIGIKLYAKRCYMMGYLPQNYFKLSIGIVLEIQGVKQPNS